MVAILDADKEGFLRSETALIQTIGRAARNVNGKVIMYAEKITDSMRAALDETNRRRAKQDTYNKLHNIEPVTIIKAIHDITQRLSPGGAAALAEGRGSYKAGKTTTGIPKKELQRLIIEMEKEMKQAAKDLEFERAAVLRDQLYELKKVLAEESDLPPWEAARMMASDIEEG